MTICSFLRKSIIIDNERNITSLWQVGKSGISGMWEKVVIVVCGKKQHQWYTPFSTVLCGKTVTLCEMFIFLATGVESKRSSFFALRY